MNRSSMLIPPALVRQLKQAHRVAVLTGAGISAESGVPTFREAQTGLWANYNPEELATPEAFQANPKLVWDWYAWRRQLVAEAEPNPGHLALAQLEKIIPKFTLITQNVDGLHQQAGNRNVVELHGNINRVICPVDQLVIDSWDEREDGPPCCPQCGTFLRPNVVWFGEMLPTEALQDAIFTSQECDLFMVIGTSALVYPAAALPYSALERRMPVVEINPSETPLTAHATYALPAAAGKILPELVAQVEAGS